MIIDVYAHYISPAVSRMIEGGIYSRHYRFPGENADPEVRLALMDKYGISVQALSQTSPVTMGFSPEKAAEICRISNDDNYLLCKQYPARFVNICVISLLDMKSALHELERCVSELDCRGITVSSNQEGKGLDSPEYCPFYEFLVKHDLPLFIHPAHWSSYPLVDMDKGWRMMHIFGWPFDSTQAVWRLIMGGVIDWYPELKVIVHHMGALLPYFRDRINVTFNRHLSQFLPRHISEYWSNFYGDTAIDGNIPAFPLGYAFFGPDRLMYGTDYPFGAESGEAYIRDNLAGINALELPEDIRERILGENARTLLKID